MRRALRRVAGFPFAPWTRYVNRRFEDVHVHLEQTNAALAGIASRLDRLEAQPGVDLTPVEELMVLVHQEVRRLGTGTLDPS
jgi:hypothetical protein